MLIRRCAFLFALVCILFALPCRAQNYGTIQGNVKDPSGASVPGATVTIADPVSGLHRDTMTDTNGDFRFTNIPFNPYHLTVVCDWIHFV